MSALVLRRNAIQNRWVYAEANKQIVLDAFAVKQVDRLDRHRQQNV